jgi:predicted metal-dependent hydrolase
MKGILTIKSHKIPFEIIKRANTRKISMKISSFGDVKVSIPKIVPYKIGKIFLDKNLSWVEKHLPQKPRVVLTSPQIANVRIKARDLIRQRIDHYNQFYKFKFNRITIRDQKTRWGSCSSDKTLSFNYRLGLLPLELVDYVVVHELCHLKEMNHSQKFWDLVKMTLPHYPWLKNQLRKHEKEIT